ncbi:MULTISPECIES: pitrilysin family protein [unclassified Helicobacter]|uniref:M16 family metallopeptidase n=1 Tax=unclassified Helicobacter TaxID=2593540 RepID=UPI0021629178|nr:MULTISPECIES: pitrilysin family protein [unclassified Helicobacter]
MKARILSGIIAIMILIGGVYLMVSQQKDDQSVEYVEINDVRVPIIFEKSTLLPRGFIQLVFNGGGSLYDNVENLNAPSKAGLAELSALLLDEGTQNLGSVEFAKKLESKAIDLSISASTQTLSFSLEFLKEYQDFAQVCLLELLKDPNVSEGALQKVKMLTKASLLAKENDFDYIAKKNLRAIFFEGTPMAFPANGDLQSIESINLQDIKDYLQKNLVLSRLVIVAGGDMELDSLKKSLKESLGFLPKGESVKKPHISPRATLTSITETKPTEQAFIYFASPFNASIEENYKTKVMSFVLGGSGFGSRLMEEVRVKRGLAYSVYFSINGGSDLVNFGSGALQTGLDSKDEAISVLKEVMAEFIKNGITQEELDSAKAFLLGSEPLGEETLSQRLNTKFANYLRSMPLDSHKQDIAKITDLSLEEINEFIKAHSEILDLSFSIVDEGKK